VRFSSAAMASCVRPRRWRVAMSCSGDTDEAWPRRRAPATRLAPFGAAGVASGRPRVESMRRMEGPLAKRPTYGCPTGRPTVHERPLLPSTTGDSAANDLGNDDADRPPKIFLSLAWWLAGGLWCIRRSDPCRLRRSTQHIGFEGRPRR
jgi:hypothetical protein